MATVDLPAPGGPLRKKIGVLLAPALIKGHGGLDRRSLQTMSQNPDPRFTEIVVRFGIPTAHSRAALAQAKALEPATDDPGLDDLTDLPFCTIDNADSRDLDQALYIQRTRTGWDVYYALADAAFFVRPGTVLFAEALERGSSYYLPHVSYPMLPRRLSEDLVSLNPGVVRRALLMRMTLAPDGRCTRTTVSRARIRSRAKLTYTGVQALYDGDPTLEEHPYTDSLKNLRTVGLKRLELAAARNVVAYDRGPRPAVEEYNAQISLLCNAEGARLLAESENPAIEAVFRAHPEPPAERLDAFARLTADLARERDLADAWRWDRTKPLAEYLAALPTSPARLRRAINRQAVMTNVRSVFQADLAPHYGVGVAAYARFSSPMREIVGIYTHWEALQLLGAERSTTDPAIREQVIRAGNRSKQLQKRLDKEVERLEIDDLLNGDARLPRRRRPWRRGTVMGLVPTRIYVQLDEPRLDLKVYNRQRRRGINPTLGDALDLRVRQYDARRRRWVFDLR